MSFDIEKMNKLPAEARFFDVNEIWDIIDHGYRANFLWADYLRGLNAAHTPVCDTATCHICGLC